MADTKRDLIQRLIFKNAENTAMAMGITQILRADETDFIMKRPDAAYDSAGDKRSEKEIDYNVKTMISCGALSEKEIKLLSEFLSGFPEGSQAAFTHSLGEMQCQRILSDYGIKIYEHANLNAIAKCAGEKFIDGERLFYCLAVKFSLRK